MFRAERVLRRRVRTDAKFINPRRQVELSPPDGPRERDLAIAVSVDQVRHGGCQRPAVPSPSVKPYKDGR